ncbi:alanine aminotransferase 1-like isoform X2 [Lampris incognitus]|uniref:alanine aminotransferase 1-like isoform X2 n=1 Tax=Lampris incognitus TaxID=2546036 RepID=UPI0024B51B4F|nr:alanine aminotransferase 1-like isoform X2 [Lampris incognitus]
MNGSTSSSLSRFKLPGCHCRNPTGPPGVTGLREESREMALLKATDPQGGRKRREDVIDLSMADPHNTGLRPLTFVRQPGVPGAAGRVPAVQTSSQRFTLPHPAVLAACIYPPLTNSDKLPADVRQRAQRLLGACAGGSVGSYTPTGGMAYIQQSLCTFISQRDGGVPALPGNIFITCGSQTSIMQIFNLLVNGEGSPKTGVLTPVPSHHFANSILEGLGATVVPYYLNEEQGWELQRAELRRALQSARGICNPAALYVVNPGNPTGHVQSRKSIQDVIQFVSEEKLFLLADEVYQETVLGEESEFVSYKRVLAEMGPPHSDTVELASFHSVSKGLMGECGLRGGYVELVNLDPAVMKHVNTQFSTLAGSAATGQIALDLMANPPQPGDPSYRTYEEETQYIKATLVQNVKRVTEVLNDLPGLSCQPVKGGAVVFPRLHLPPGAIQRAEEEGMPPDCFYSRRLFEEAGLCVSPGCEHGQREGTHHVRFCVTTTPDTMEEALRRLAGFHTQFMKDFS